MNNKLIQELREGKVAVKNDGSLNDLRKVLNYAFPKDDWPITGVPKYYYTYNCFYWQGLQNTDLPSYSVKEFLKEEEFVLPEKWCVKTTPNTRQLILDFIISKGYNSGGPLSYDYYLHFPLLSSKGSAYSCPKIGYTEITFEQFKKYVLKEETMEKKIKEYRVKPEFRELSAILFTKCEADNKGGFGRFDVDSNVKDFYRKAGILDLWFEPVYEEEIKLPKINNYEAEINGDFLVYGCAKFAIRNIKDLCEDILSFNKPDVKLKRYSGGNRSIASIKLSSGVNITVTQLEQILKYLNAKGL